MPEQSLLKLFWEDIIDWNVVASCLDRYKNISNVFSLKFLQEYGSKPPFYIHPLTRWLFFQGVNTKPALDRLDESILNISKCDGWLYKKRIFSSFGEGSFWNTYSEIQVASSLKDLGFKIEFIQKENTYDLDATKNWKLLNIEVTSYSLFFIKCFELEQTLEIINKTHPLLKRYKVDIEISRNIGIPSGYSSGGIEQALDDTMKFISNKDSVRKVIKVGYPQHIYNSDNLQIEANAIKGGNFLPSYSMMGGNLDDYITNLLLDIEDKKNGYKQLEPGKGIKICATNILFNTDAQIALRSFHSRTNYKLKKIDAIFLFATSIDEKMSFKKNYYIFKNKRVEKNLETLFNLK